MLDSNLRAMSMFGLISINYHFLTQHIFLQKWPMFMGRTFPVSNLLLSVTSRHHSNDAKEADILNRSGLPLNAG